MEPDKERAVAALAEQNHGVFTSDQATRLGFADHHREQRLRTGRWVAVHPTVYRFAGTPLTWRGAVLAASWSTTGLAAASHRTAGALWELPGGVEHPVE